MQSMHKLNQRCLGLTVLTMAFVLPTGSRTAALAQFFGAHTGRASVSGQFIEPDRLIRQAMSDANKAIAEERFGDAIILLGELLARGDQAGMSEMQGQDFFLKNNRGSLADDSLMRQAERRLGELPAKGIELYELRYGPTAMADLRSAVQQRDWQAIAEVSRKYLHTNAGQQATLLLGQHRQIAGRPLAAAITLDRLYRHANVRSKLGPPLAVMLAGNWYQAGDDQRAVETLLGAGIGQVRIGDENIDLSPLLPLKDRITDWLAKHFARLSQIEGELPENQPIAGGNPSRTGYRGREIPMRRERWMKQTTWSTRQREYLESYQASRAASGVFPIPSWQPIVVGNTVMAKTTEGMVAIDYTTGKSVWEFPWFNETPIEAAAAMSQIPDDDRRHQILVQRVWNDLPFGRISSDGTRAYMLTGLSEVRPASFSQFRIGVQGTRKSGDSTNTLLALDIATEGKLVWTIGDEDTSEPALADTFFLGPPLPVDGLLYVMGEQKGDIFLICLNPETGRQVWRQHLVAVETGSIENDTMRRIGGAMPAYADGTLVCPTGNGAIVAIDLTTRAFRWGFSFRRTDITQMMRHMAGRGINSAGGASALARWHDGTPVVAGDCVLFTPIEADRLYAINLLTGKLKWQPLPREDWRYLAGVDGDVAVLVSGGGVRGIGIADGQRRWDYELPDQAGESIAGRGVFGGGQFMFPTNRNRLISLDTQSGTKVASDNVFFPIGNLVSMRGELLSQSATHIALARGRRSTSINVERTLLANPDDFLAIVRKGELLLEEGKRAEALRWLQRARARDQDNEEVRVLLVQALLGTLRDGREADPKEIAMLENLAQRPVERVAYLRLMTEGLMKSKDYLKATEYLLDLSLPDANVLGVTPYSLSETIKMTDGGEVDLDGWITARVQQIADAADVDTLAKINELVAQRLASLSSPVGPRGQQVARHFARLPACDAAQLAIASRFRKEGSLLKAERLMRSTLLRTEDVRQRDKWNAMLAIIYLQIGWNADAVDYYARIQSPETLRLEPALQGQLTRLGQLAEKPAQKTLNPTNAWAWPNHVHVEKMDMPSENLTPSDALQVRQRRGAAFADWKILVNDSSDTVQLQSPLGTLGPQHRLEGGLGDKQGPKQVYIDHGIMVVVLPTTIIGIDLFRAGENPNDLEIWRHVWRGGARAGKIQSRPTTNAFGQVTRVHLNAQRLPAMRTSGIVGGRMAWLQGQKLSVVDVLTGKPHWQRDVDVEDGYLAIDESMVAVISPRKREVQRFNLYDGAPLASLDTIHADERIWAINGDKVLSFAGTKLVPAQPTTHLRLWNATSGNDILSDASIAPGTKGQVVDNRYVTFIQPDGTLNIWDLAAGRSLVTDKLELGGTLASVHALIWQDRIVVMPDVRRAGGSQLKLLRESGNRHIAVSGPTMAYDLSSGERTWDQVLDLQEYGITINQPTGGPLMFLSRRQRPIKPSNRSLTWTLSVQAIDMRTGRLASHTEGLVARTSPSQISTHVLINPRQSEYIVMVDRNRLSFKLSDDPAEEKQESGQGSSEKKAPDHADTSSLLRQREPFGLFQPVE